jgi:hypothetical protein
VKDPIHTLRVWSYYVLGMGAILAAAPNVVLGLFGVAETDEVWIRVAGLIAIALGVVYTGAVRAGHVEIVRASVTARAVVVLGFIVLAVTAGPWQLLIFGAVDAAGAAWSWAALRPSPT